MKTLSPLAMRGLNHFGDALIPGGIQGLPSFSDLGCAEKVELLLSEMPEQDVKDLQLLLSIFGVLPTFCARWFFALLEWANGFQTPHFGILRLMRLGLKGLVMSLYYSGYAGKNYQGPKPLDVLDYHVRVSN